jgi:hypothetical protein
MIEGLPWSRRVIYVLLPPTLDVGGNRVPILSCMASWLRRLFILLGAIIAWNVLQTSWRASVLQGYGVFLFFVVHVMPMCKW